ncbi:MAG: hypothetical protein ACYTG5_17945 [Planctomycetota bacterium]
MSEVATARALFIRGQLSFAKALKIKTKRLEKLRESKSLRDGATSISDLKKDNKMSRDLQRDIDEVLKAGVELKGESRKHASEGVRYLAKGVMAEKALIGVVKTLVQNSSAFEMPQVLQLAKMVPGDIKKGLTTLSSAIRLLRTNGIKVPSNSTAMIGGFDGRPGDDLDGQPGDDFDGQPGDDFDGQPGDDFDGQPGGALDGRPDGDCYGQLVGELDEQLVGELDGQLVSDFYARLAAACDDQSVGDHDGQPTHGRSKGKREPSQERTMTSPSPAEDAASCDENLIRDEVYESQRINRFSTRSQKRRADAIVERKLEECQSGDIANQPGERITKDEREPSQVQARASRPSDSNDTSCDEKQIRDDVYKRQQINRFSAPGKKRRAEAIVERKLKECQ